MIFIKREDIKICILRIEGTNNEDEVYYSFHRLHTRPEIIHLKQLWRDKKKLDEYQMLVIPGGFSTGDYVRAGAIFASLIRSKLEREVLNFVDEGKPMLGICNGFQVMVEMGLLPGFNKMVTESALTTNDSGRFECRPTLLKHVNNNNCIFTKNIKKDIILSIPSAHAEGKFIFSKEKQEEYVDRLIDNDMIVFRCVDKEGNYASYPWNPNGSIYNIAGICNPEGNILGLMPHPERAFYKFLHSNTRGKDIYGDGKLIFDSMLNWLERKF